MSSQLLFYIVFSVVLHRGLSTVNFALHKSAVQSTTLYYNNFYWTADKAVDRNSDGSNPDISRTCSSTQQSGGVWVNQTWEVDIGFQIIVKTITVYGRTDGPDNLSGVKLFIGNVSRPWIYNQELPSNSSSTTKYVFKPNNAIGSVISLMRFNSILMLCEVTVEGECLGGMFSEFCNLTCGKCFADQPCNKENGTCPLECDQGRKGTLCKEDCERGNYGYNCNETCGKCLYGNNSCSITYGKCSNGCITGWQGDKCNTDIDECSSNLTCRNGGTCNNTAGSYSCICTRGWNGANCTTDVDECSSNLTCQNGGNCTNTNGSYSCICTSGWNGANCTTDVDECSSNLTCQNGGNCTNTNGSYSCICTSGWNGANCTTDVDECSSNLTCQNGGNCTNTNGSYSCICTRGWNGANCTTEARTHESLAIPVPGIAGGTVAGFVAILCLVIGIFLWRRYQHAKQNEHDIALEENRNANIRPPENDSYDKLHLYTNSDIQMYDSLTNPETSKDSDERYENTRLG